MGEQQLEMRQVGQRIRQLRRNWKLSQRELATKLSLSHATVAHWEVGDQKIGLPALHRVARLFGVRPEWLMSGEDPLRVPTVCASAWPADEMRSAFGYDVPAPPKGWPPEMVGYVSQALRFAATPSASQFVAMWGAARTMGSAELPLGIERALQPPHAQVFDILVTANDAALESAEKAVIAAFQVK